MKKQKGTSAPKREVRTNTASQKPLTIRTLADGSRTIAGIGVVYGVLSQDLGGFREQILPGAFTRSLRNKDLDLILYNHDAGQVLGRVSAGTATVTDSPTGLGFQCKLGDASFANDVASMLTRGDVSQMSFGFRVVPGGDTWSEIGDYVLRTVNEAEIFELSVVSMPAYTQSSVGLRSALASCPVDLRKRINAEDIDPDLDDDEDDDDSEDEGDEDRSCSCQCESCLDGLCSDCTADACHDDDCTGCPMQDEARSDSLRVRRVFALRMQ